MIEFEIDGKKITASEGATIIEAADQEGIYIPRFCYHKKLSIAANCRMCLVEVEKMGKPQPACATPVSPGMVVYTQSKKTLEAQRAVMEFLLINHPLDCPICDQGGECELQDLAMGYGTDRSDYREKKRAVESPNLGPLIETEMTRCIQCTRCVRFGEEVAGLPELGLIGRGEHEEISTYIQHFLQSELSGNIIDICPVGALTAKPSRYEGRAWEYREHPGIAAHDCVGSHIYVHSRGHQYSPVRNVMRVVPRENEQINEMWLSDRDRFSYLGLHHESRLLTPQMKKEGKWVVTDWETALNHTVDCIKSALKKHGAQQIAGLISPNSTLEEQSIFQRFVRALGSPHVDYRLRQQDFESSETIPPVPHLGIKITELDQMNVILLVGSYLRHEQPILAQRVNQAVQDGVKVIVINPYDYAFTFPVEQKWIIEPQRLVMGLAEILKALAELTGKTISELNDIHPSDSAKKIAQQLKSAGRSLILSGEHALNHPQAQQIQAYIRQIAQLSSSCSGVLTEGANSAGARLAGCIPDSHGLNAKTVLTEKPVKTYLLFNTELEYDSAYPGPALESLKKADFVACFTPFVSDKMREYADVIFPITPFTEMEGTFVNVEGHWQSFSSVSPAQGEAKSGWKVLRVLANLLDLKAFDYNATREIRDELADKMNAETLSVTHSAIAKPSVIKGLMRFAPWPLYAVDNIVRRADALQALLPIEVNTVRINTATAKQLNLMDVSLVAVVQDDQREVFELQKDDRLADNTVLLPSGTSKTAGFGRAEFTVTLERVTQ